MKCVTFYICTLSQTPNDMMCCMMLCSPKLAASQYLVRSACISCNNRADFVVLLVVVHRFWSSAWFTLHCYTVLLIAVQILVPILFAYTYVGTVQHPCKAQCTCVQSGTEGALIYKHEEFVFKRKYKRVCFTIV